MEMEEFFQESIKGLLPRNIKNSVYMDDHYEIIEASEILENEPVKINKNKFYSIVLEVEHIDTLIFNERKYKQKVYEFKSKEEQNKFIENGKITGKLVEEQSKVLNVVDDENVTYLVSCGNNKKVLEKDYILDEYVFNTFRGNEMTKVIFYPSLDTYIFNCHDDYIIEATNLLSNFSVEETTPEEFIEEVELALGNDGKLEYKYIGKSNEVSSKESYSTSDESVFVVSTFPIVDIIFSDKSIEALSNLVYYKKLCDAIQNGSLDDIKFITEFLMKNQILNAKGELLEPYKNAFYVDDSTKKNKGTSKTKTNKKTNK